MPQAVKTLLVIFGCVIALTARSASAQPFFGGGAIAFAPEISIVYSGVVLDVQPVVSYDNKYVTFGIQVQDSRLLALRSFQVQSGVGGGPALGFVGGVTTSTIAPLVASSDSPDAIDRRVVALRSVLARQGMFLLRVN